MEFPNVVDEREKPDSMYFVIIKLFDQTLLVSSICALLSEKNEDTEIIRWNFHCAIATTESA